MLVPCIPVKPARKITIEVPEDPLRYGQDSTGEGITQTIRRGLQLVAAGRAYEDLRRLRGRVKMSLDVRRLRDDRAGSQRTRARSSPISPAPPAPMSRQS